MIGIPTVLASIVLFITFNEYYIMKWFSSSFLLYFAFIIAWISSWIWVIIVKIMIMIFIFLVSILTAVVIFIFALAENNTSEWLLIWIVIMLNIPDRNLIFKSYMETFIPLSNLSSLSISSFAKTSTAILLIQTGIIRVLLIVFIIMVVVVIARSTYTRWRLFIGHSEPVISSSSRLILLKLITIVIVAAIYDTVSVILIWTRPIYSN